MLVVMSVDPIYNDGAMSTSDIGADQKFVSVERRRQVWTMDNEWLREVMMGECNGVASVIMLTFTKMPGPHADTAWAVVG